MSEQAMEQAAAPSVEARAAEFLFGKPKAAPQPAPKVREVAQEPPAETVTTEQAEASNESNEAGDKEPLKTAEEIFELEVDGETYALPKALEKSLLSSREYTQKSQKVADRERSFEVLHEQARIANFRQQFESENAQKLQQLQAYDSVLAQQVDWNSMSTDDAFRKKIQIDEWKGQREQIARELGNSHQQWMRKQEQAIADLRMKADEAVTKRIPNWTKDSWTAIRDHAKSDGYTEAELNDIIDPRHKITLWKAQQFDQLKAKATKTVTDVKAVKTSPSNPMPQHVKEKLSFNKVLSKTAPGSIERKTAVESRIGSIFAKKVK